MVMEQIELERIEVKQMEQKKIERGILEQKRMSKLIASAIDSDKRTAFMYGSQA